MSNIKVLTEFLIHLGTFYLSLNFVRIFVFNFSKNMANAKLSFWMILIRKQRISLADGRYAMVLKYITKGVSDE